MKIFSKRNLIEAVDLDLGFAAPAPPVAAPVRVSLAAAMQDAPVSVTGVLCRKRVSLAELRGFLDGRLLSLPRT